MPKKQLLVALIFSSFSLIGSDSLSLSNKKKEVTSPTSQSNPLAPIQPAYTIHSWSDECCGQRKFYVLPEQEKVLEDAISAEAQQLKEKNKNWSGNRIGQYLHLSDERSNQQPLKFEERIDFLSERMNRLSCCAMEALSYFQTSLKTLTGNDLLIAQKRGEKAEALYHLQRPIDYVKATITYIQSLEERTPFSKDVLDEIYHFTCRDYKNLIRYLPAEEYKAATKTLAERKKIYVDQLNRTNISKEEKEKLKFDFTDWLDRDFNQQFLKISDKKLRKKDTKENAQKWADDKIGSWEKIVISQCFKGIIPYTFHQYRAKLPLFASVNQKNLTTPEKLLHAWSKETYRDVHELFHLWCKGDVKKNQQLLDYLKQHKSKLTADELKKCIYTHDQLKENTLIDNQETPSIFYDPAILIDAITVAYQRCLDSTRYLTETDQELALINLATHEADWKKQSTQNSPIDIKYIHWLHKHAHINENKSHSYHQAH